MMFDAFAGIKRQTKVCCVTETLSTMYLLPFYLTIFAATTVQVVQAHRPLLTKPSCGVDYGSSATALSVEDPTISWAFKHYADCTNRVLWVSFTNPEPNFNFYAGVGVPTLERFADIRTNALIIGPGLPTLSEEDWSSLPEEVRSDPVWTSSQDDNNNIGAYYHISPADQSTCDHLGKVMSDSSTVLNGRCDFYEPFGGSHSWRVLDADNNVIPVSGATYYVAIFPQNNVSAKYGVALGTWVENFVQPFNIETPTCTRDISDFKEEINLRVECFPNVSCTAINLSAVGCNNNASAQQEDICELGQVCDSGTGDEVCEIGGITYQTPTMGACGGERCPAAVQLWEAANMKMHMGMMDLQYTGDADIDFVRQMIPHHSGAVDMCNILIQNVTCAEVDDIDNLEGLVHFCSHVEYKQDLEIGGLRKWLKMKGLNETAPCPSKHMDNTHGGGNHSSIMNLSDSCGLVESESSQKLINLNMKMHNLMSVDYSCNHSVDFVRMMIPHHAGAVEMCDNVLETTQDGFIIELCANVTLTQRAEIAWMHEWLSNREHAISAPCGNCDLMPDSEDMASPCEDLLSTSVFCHGLGFGQDGYCKCEDTFAATNLTCDSLDYVDGIGVFVPTNFCQRSCGLCPNDSSALFWPESCHEANTTSKDSAAVALVPTCIAFFIATAVGAFLV